MKIVAVLFCTCNSITSNALWNCGDSQFFSVVNLQIGRSTESPIDFVVTDTSGGAKDGEDPSIAPSTISRFACRIVCERNPPYTARIYAAGFDSSKNIFLGVSRLKPSQQMYFWKNRQSSHFQFVNFVPLQEKATKWKNPDGHMDGLTTNGVLVMHPDGFPEDPKQGLWREISVCGDVYALRETRSGPSRGKLVSRCFNNFVIFNPLHVPFNVFCRSGPYRRRVRPARSVTVPWLTCAAPPCCGGQGRV